MFTARLAYRLKAVATTLFVLSGFSVFVIAGFGVQASAENDLPPGFENLQPGFGFCEGAYWVGGLDVGFACTHGPDPSPPMFVDDNGEVIAANAGDGTPECIGDGTSGNRVQVLYAHATDVTSRYDTVKPDIIGWISSVDEIFELSARKTGGILVPRWVMDPGCELSVLEIEIPANADGTNFNAFLTAMRDLGFTDIDRKYLVFTDANALCGIAALYVDDDPTPANLHNGHTSLVSRVDRGCWGPSTAAHEIMHTLGGVQPSAPNSTQGLHCTDEEDVMCYVDGAGVTMSYICDAETEGPPALFDCGNDDYFAANPGPGNYLLDHWNTANNSFLGVPPLTVDLTATLTPPASAEAGTTVEWTVSVVNNGVDEAVDVVTDIAIPADVEAIGIASDDGSCSSVAGNVNCTWPTFVSPGASRTVTISADIPWSIPDSDLLTFTVNTASTNEEAVAIDNTDEQSVAVSSPDPTPDAADVEVVEGDSGTVAALIPFTLDHPTYRPFEVEFVPIIGAGDSADSTDVPLVPAVAVVPTGETAAIAEIPITPDVVFESDETFSVIVEVDGTPIMTTQVTLLNDDPEPRAPSAPRAVIAEAGFVQATIQWTPPADLGTAPISEILVTTTGQPKATPILSLDPAATSVVIANLNLGTAYNFDVRYRNAAGLSEPATSATVVPDGFLDVTNSPFISDIYWLANQGVTSGCSSPFGYCPNDHVTRAQMATFLVRALELPPAPPQGFLDTVDSPHATNIDALAAAGVTAGCGDGNFCPLKPVTRGQMATFLVRALSLPGASSQRFIDTRGHAHESSIDSLAAARITSGCGGGRFCPNGTVNRGQMAAFLHRALT